MQNIWKYSLLLAFSIIIDQLFKGSAQSLVDVPNSHELIFSPLFLVRARSFFFAFNLDLGLSALWSNRISLVVIVSLLVLSLWWTVKWRNSRPLAGWSLSLISCGLFSSFMDRYSHGYTLDYLALRFSEKTWLNFSLGDIELTLGMILGLLLVWKRRSVK